MFHQLSTHSQSKKRRQRGKKLKLIIFSLSHNFDFRCEIREGTRTHHITNLFWMYHFQLSLSIGKMSLKFIYFMFQAPVFALSLSRLSILLSAIKNAHKVIIEPFHVCLGLEKNEKGMKSELCFNLGRRRRDHLSLPPILKYSRRFNFLST